MKNFPVKVDGKTYWISRSVAVAVSIFTKINGEMCVLANRRGPGLPNHVGEWNVVSGYLDFDESLHDACVREVWEETGVDIKKVRLIRMDIEDEPTRENQVVLFRYTGFIENGGDLTLTAENSEDDEVSEIKWVPVSKLSKYHWTSEKHKQKIKDYSEFLITLNSD